MPIIKSEYIRRKLSYIKSMVEDDTKQKLYDINTSAEYIFMQILNDVYGWSLINANEEKPNFPAIDLIDTVNETVFQVTSEISTKKVREETIEKFNELVKQVEYKKYAHYKIKMFYIKNKPNFSDKILEEFESKGVPKSHLYGIEDINREVSANPIIATKVFKTLCKILHDKVCDSDTPPNLTTKSSTHDSSFIGREDEVKAIDEMLESSNSLLLINGIGGIGKSSLANYYLYTREKKFDYYGFIDGLDSFISEFRNSLDLKTQKEEELYREIISKLQGLQGKKLLVIDNVEDIESHKNLIEMLLSLPKYNYKILFTSRRKIKNVKSYPLGTLLLVDAQKLFLNYFKKEERAKLDKSKVNEIIDYLGLHTLFIKLVAETIENEGYSLDNILEKFEHGELSKVVFGDEESDDDITFNKILQDLFSMQTLNDRSKLLLKRLAVLPSIDIELSFLEEILGKERLKRRLDFLVSRGWLIENEGSYKLHQIIKEFMLANYLPNFKEMEILLNSFLEIMGVTVDIKESVDNQNNIIYFESLATIFDRKEIENKKIGIFFNNFGNIYRHLSIYQKAEQFYLKALKIYENLLGTEHPTIAITYGNLAGVYQSIGDYIKAKSFYIKALKIHEKVFGKEHSTTAISYHNLASLYHSMGDYQKAEPLYLKALKIEQETWGEEHPRIALNYNNLADLYLLMEEYQKVESLHLKALKIRKMVLGEYHPDTAQSYNNLAGFYWMSIVNYKKAEPLYLKALKIKEKVWGEEHPNIAETYHNLSIIYHTKYDYEKAYKYVKKAISAWLKVLPDNHPNLINSKEVLDVIEMGMNRKNAV